MYINISFYCIILVSAGYRPSALSSSNRNLSGKPSNARTAISKFKIDDDFDDFDDDSDLDIQHIK